MRTFHFTFRKARTLAVAALTLVALGLGLGQPVATAQQGQEAQAVAPGAGAFTPEQRKQIEAIVREYLLKNPEVMLEVQSVLEAKMEKVQSEREKVAIAENAQDLFKRANAPMAGNPKGDITIVEFFDYNCGYCKRAFNDIAKLIDKDPKVKFVFKELPILTKGSEEASKVALAARMQGKYWEVHKALIEAKGQLNEATALKTAERLGLDMARLKRDMDSPEVKAEIDSVRQLAQKMGIQGTPHFLVGDRPIAGAPENLLEVMTRNVQELRKTGCQVC